jgi:hypothetical protein
LEYKELKQIYRVIREFREQLPSDLDVEPASEAEVDELIKTAVNSRGSREIQAKVIDRRPTVRQRYRAKGDREGDRDEVRIQGRHEVESYGEVVSAHDQDPDAKPTVRFGKLDFDDDEQQK